VSQNRAAVQQVDFATIQVNATLQGASAETMAVSVAAPLERQFGQIPGVTQLTSMSALNGTSITIQFELNRNIDSAAQDVQAAITVAGRTLPQQMSTPPSYKKVNPADSPVMMLAARSDTLPLYIVDDAGISTRNGILKISRYINLALREGATFGPDLVMRGSLDRLAPVLLTPCRWRIVEFDTLRRGPHAHFVSRLRPQAARAAFGCPCGGW
jgi:Cu/Ag efflux pump CusA